MQEHCATPPSNAPISARTAVMATRKNKCENKWNWFHSLTRNRKTSFSQPSIAPINTEFYLSTQQIKINNNEGDDINSGGLVAAVMEAKKKPDLEKNAFQRFKRMSLQLLTIKRRESQAPRSSCTTNATAEFLTHSDETETVPFTLHFKRFVVKKWLGRDDDPNQIMYKASSEMLGQVWYWGEISRRDAQKQLTDKPTGSFLVRDSETSGTQFTLSFRIVNLTLHYRLEYRDNYWHFEELQYESIVEMIEDILFRCTNDSFVCFVRVPNEMHPPFPVILKYPLSRYLKIPKLQDLCRRVIQRHNTEEEITKLPLPAKLHEYLREKRELVFQ